MNKYQPNNKPSEGLQDSNSPDNLLLYDSNQFFPVSQSKFSNRHILSLKNTNIKEVWDYNFEEEFYKIMDLIENYNVIALVKLLIFFSFHYNPRIPSSLEWKVALKNGKMTEFYYFCYNLCFMEKNRTSNTNLFAKT